MGDSAPGIFGIIPLDYTDDRGEIFSVHPDVRFKLRTAQSPAGLENLSIKKLNALSIRLIEIIKSI